jgi:hypothetical protein
MEAVHPTIYSKTKDKEIEEIVSFIEKLHQQEYKYNEMAIGCRVKDSIKEIKSVLHK